MYTITKELSFHDLQNLIRLGKSTNTVWYESSAVKHEVNTRLRLND